MFFFFGIITGQLILQEKFNCVWILNLDVDIFKNGSRFDLIFKTGSGSEQDTRLQVWPKHPDPQLIDMDVLLKKWGQVLLF